MSFDKSTTIEDKMIQHMNDKYSDDNFTYKAPFGGGAGAGVSIKPEGFLVISPDGSVKMVGMDSGSDPISSAVNAVPGIVEKVQAFLAKKKGGESAESTADVTISD